jgi:hypothetical protein
MDAGTPIKWLWIGWRASEIQELKFNIIRALLTKKIQVEKEKSKIRYLWTQLNFIQGLIEFMKLLIARKIDF